MKSILLITAKFFESTSATSLCVRNLADEFAARGFHVYVINDSDKPGIMYDDNGMTVIGVKRSAFSAAIERLEGRNGLCNLLILGLRVLHGLAFGLVYPDSSPVRSGKVYKKAAELVRQHGISCVTGFYRPYEPIKAALKLKRNFPELFVSCWHMDLLLSPYTGNKLEHGFKLRRSQKAVGRELETLDLLLLPHSAEGTVPDAENVKFTDFPVYKDASGADECEVPFSGEFINLSYMGTIDGKNRDLVYISELIKAANMSGKTGKPMKLHIWGRIADTVSNDIIAASDFIEFHGSVENRFTTHILKCSDFCLNLANRLNYDMIPSKIFQMFSVARPIINIVGNAADKSLPYFMRNDYTLMIPAYENDPVREAEKLTKFVNNMSGRVIKTDPELYIESTPGYAADLILKSAEARKKN